MAADEPTVKQFDFEKAPTPPFEVFLTHQTYDPNLFWRIGCGHHQNLLDDAITRIEIALQQHNPHCTTCGVDNCQTRRILTTQHGGE
jgi:hypothetical protein